MLRVAICDNQSDHLEHTLSMVRKELLSYPLETEIYTSARSFLEAVKAGNARPDIAVLDILLEEESDTGANGIALAKQLNALLPACSVIFLTGYPEYAPASYEARHTWFVLKSSADTYLGPALRRAVSETDDNSPLGLAARISGKTFSLPLGDVLYLDRVARKTRIVCRDAVYAVTSVPSVLLNSSVSPFFVRCHQGYWVNLRHVTELDKNEFVLSTGARIPISRSFREVARKKFFEQLMNHDQIKNNVIQ